MRVAELKNGEIQLRPTKCSRKRTRLGAFWWSNRASNIFLDIFANLGILGMGLFGLFIFEVVRAVWYRRDSSEMTAVTKNLCVGWLMMLTVGFIAVPDITTFMFFWLVPALAVVANNLAQVHRH